MLHPMLFLGGSLLIASPIIIHLLNKRRFRTVDWAAMDFLIQADKRNRKRIRLENLLLLLLRCLLVLLIALLVARPFRTLQATDGLLGSARFERVILLDDSFSMAARREGGSSLDAAKDGLIKLVKNLVASGSND
ncbi:MAG: BatA domain-containing protein, partial [Planctomycetales bacterium]